MIHLRYLVYSTPQDPLSRHVLFWTTEVIHEDYARKHNIPLSNFLSAGYMRPYWGGWIPYEHYQLDGGSARIDKALVKEAFKKYPELQTPELANAVQQTFYTEQRIAKKLLLKEILSFFFSRIRQ